MFDRKQLLRIVHPLRRLLHEDALLFDVGVQERSLAFRLGLYLQEEFNEWCVDAEYNRSELVIKRFSHHSGKQWFCSDLSIHKRREKQNLIAFEIKAYPDQTMADDRQKLRSITSPAENYEYDFGILLAFVWEKPLVALAEVYIAGLLNEEATMFLLTTLEEKHMLED